MFQTLVAALAIGFASGPADAGKDVMEVRPSNRWLLVGTWEVRLATATVLAWEFRRGGQCTLTVRDPDGTADTFSGTYRVEGRRLAVQLTGCRVWRAEVVQVDLRVLAYRWPWASDTWRFRRQ
jgi:uncharacterized protein (TIGR03066 family)